MPIQQMLLGAGGSAVDNGGSMYFAGTDGDDYIQVSSTSSAYQLGTGDFTLECWIKTTTSGSDGFYRRIYLHDGTQNNYAGHLQLAVTPNANTSNEGGAKINPWDNGTLDITGDTTVSNGEWNHIAVVRNSGTVRAFVNGSYDERNKSYAGQSWNQSIDGQEPRIGSQNGSGGWEGKISNLRLVKGTALYNAEFTPPTEPLEAISGTVVLACQGSSRSTTPSSWTTTGTVTVDDNDNPFDSASDLVYGNYGCSFSSSYLELGDDFEWDLSNDDFSIECWYYPLSHGSYEGLVHQWPNGNYNATNGWCLEPVGGSLDFYYCKPDGNLDHATGPSSQIPLNQWNHCAVSRLGNSIRVYLNGTHGGSHSYSGAIQNGTGPVRIGGGCAGSGNVNGYISNVRVTRRQAVYWNNFTPSTTPITLLSQSIPAPGNVNLLCCNNSSVTGKVTSPGPFSTSGTVTSVTGPF